MEQSESIGKLAAALVKVQAEIKGYRESSRNTYHNSDYGTLSDVWAAIRKPLTENGLAVIQTMDTDHQPGEVVIVTTLAHSSGEWIRGRLRLPLKTDKKGNLGPQSAGSSITYGRRYALASIVGIAPADDDAEAAEGRGQSTNGGNGKGSDDDLPEHVKLFRSKVPEVEKAIGKALAQDVFKAVTAWNNGENYTNEITVEAWLALCNIIKANGATMENVKEFLRISQEGVLDDLVGNINDWRIQANPDAPPENGTDVPL